MSCFNKFFACNFFLIIFHLALRWWCGDDDVVAAVAVVLVMVLLLAEVTLALLYYDDSFHQQFFTRTSLSLIRSATVMPPSQSLLPFFSPACQPPLLVVRHPGPPQRFSSNCLLVGTHSKTKCCASNRAKVPLEYQLEPRTQKGEARHCFRVPRLPSRCRIMRREHRE